jgi:hypothetical protein
MTERIVKNMFVSNRIYAASLIEEHNLASPMIKELQQLMVGLFLLDSKCATEFQERYFMHKLLLEFLPFDAILKFRASDHGWTEDDRKSRCYKIAPSITLFKVKDGDCIGGFTTI